MVCSGRARARPERTGVASRLASSHPHPSGAVRRFQTRSGPFLHPQSCDAEADRGSPKGSEAFARRPEFYEQYWEDADHHFEYNFEAAVQHRFPSICRVWGSLRAPGRVLDWGCGNGVLTYWMYENG